MSLNILRRTELSQDILREHLSELDTHLVKRVDTPDNTLSEYLVLVERNQSAKSGGSQLREDDTV